MPTTCHIPLWSSSRGKGMISHLFKSSITNFSRLGDVINTFRMKTLHLDAISPLWGHMLLHRLKVPFTYTWFAFYNYVVNGLVLSISGHQRSFPSLRTGGHILTLLASLSLNLGQIITLRMSSFNFWKPDLLQYILALAL